MSLLAAIALAASGVTVPTCSWDHPGVNPFMGDVVAAVDRYTDIPAATRAKLKARMEKRDYDEIALIKRDDITGLAQYGSDIRDMHFGQGSVCKTVTRAKWTPTMQERGLVYCEDGQCILVPTVCRNVSRITRLTERPLVIAPGAGVPAGSTPAPAAPVTPESPLDIEAPGAGILGGGAPASPGSFSALPPLDGGLGPTPGGGGQGPAASPPSIPLLPPTSTPTDVPTAPAVPEPSTWTLLLAGIAAIGAVIRRRR